MVRPARRAASLSRSVRAVFLFTWSFLYAITSLFLSGCSHSNAHDPSSLVFLIESNPTNLDPRFATDSQSQHLDGLLFSSLVERDDQMNIHPDLAASWDTPDPLTYIFHLRPGVRFHDGSAVTAADVQSTFDFLLNAANRSPKRGGFRQIASIEAPDPATVTFHLKEPYASFLFSISRPAIGIVPANANAPDFSRHPIGSGPFRFVSQSQDDEVILEGNPDFFAVLQRSPASAFVSSRTPSSARSNSVKVPPISKSARSRPISSPRLPSSLLSRSPNAPAPTSTISDSIYKIRFSHAAKSARLSPTPPTAHR